MPAWKSIHIERFRRLENLRFEDLGQVNLLVGKNNSGKTSALEAIALACRPLDVENWLEVGRERELKSARTPALEVFNWFFPHTTPRANGFTGSIRVHGRLASGEEHGMSASFHEFKELDLGTESAGEDEPETNGYVGTLEISQDSTSSLGIADEALKLRVTIKGKGEIAPETQTPLMPCEYITPVSHRTSRRLATAFDQVLKKRQKAELLSLLQLFSPDVADVEYLSPEGRTAVIHLYHQGIGHIPLAMEGDGMRRTLAFATAATLASGGILLVDEIETALHPEALAGVYRFLIKACRLADVQLFATTHSLEAVDAILAACDDSLDSLVAYRLPAKGSGDAIKRFGGGTVHHLRHENAMDLR